ncbi:unnamed protein product [Closterium sp. Yama58-4]|nr:unnamed protein product [Closterium sp. Yama58-4]
MKLSPCGRIEARYACESCRDTLSQIQPFKEFMRHANHLQQFADTIKGLLNTTLCDVSLETPDGAKIGAHRCILSAWSPVFARMFGGGFKEEKAGSIHIEDMNRQTLEMLLNFMYTGDVEVTEATTKELELLIAADKYGVEALKKLLDAALPKHLNGENVFECLKVSEMHSAPTLKEASAGHICDKVDRESSFKKLMELLFGDDMKDRVLAEEVLKKVWCQQKT